MADADDDGLDLVAKMIATVTIAAATAVAAIASGQREAGLRSCLVASHPVRNCGGVGLV